jgi:uncharacterized SAM-binding protein YcdF (DUF218 family)
MTTAGQNDEPAQNKITPEVISLGKRLWDYHKLDHTLEKADCIFVLGSHDTRVAEHSAKIFLQGWAPLLIFSGGLGRLTKESWTESEATLFARIAIEMGVPKEAILVEERSTNTGENILFTRQLLLEKNLQPQRFILVQKPYMERRTYATFQKQWPGNTVFVTSPDIAFDDYPTPAHPLEKIIQMVVGDLQRIRLYAEKGYQIHQHIPKDVWDAYEKLVKLGFDQQVVKTR